VNCTWRDHMEMTLVLCMWQAAAGVAAAYDLDDLDDEWKALLNELEDRLYQVQLQALHAHPFVNCECLFSQRFREASVQAPCRFFRHCRGLFQRF